MSIILNTLFHKLDAARHYQLTLEHASVCGEANGSSDDKYKPIKEMVYTGHHLFINQHLSKPITEDDLKIAQNVAEKSGMEFNYEGWEYILKTYDGAIPIKIQALPEGSVVPFKTPLYQVINTDPKCAWLVSHIEKALLRAIWLPSTVATISREIKKILKDIIDEETSIGYDDIGPEDIVLHDESFSEMSSKETADITAIAHLINFDTTEATSAVNIGNEIYSNFFTDNSGYNGNDNLVTLSWGVQNEVLAYQHFLESFDSEQTPDNTALTIDTHNAEDAVETYICEILKEKIESYTTRKVHLKCGNGITQEEVIALMEKILATFPQTTTDRGYRISHRVKIMFQYDWQSLKDFENFVKLCKASKVSINNFVLCMRGSMYQNVSKNTFQFMSSANSFIDDGGRRAAFKSFTNNSKKFKKGFLTSVNLNGEYTTGEDDILDDNKLTTVYNNGAFKEKKDFNHVRNAAKI